jgi:uncharacterized protein (TIRG00374 family)
MKLDWKAVLGITVSVFLLWLVFRGEDPAAILSDVRSADPWLLAAAALTVTLTYPIRALRWKVLLEPVEPGTSFHPRFAAVNIGFMANNLLPARVGEFARAYALSRLTPASASGAFGTLVVERFLDAMVILVLTGLVLVSPGFPRDAAGAEGTLGLALRAGAIGVAILILGLLVLLIWPRRFVRAAEVVAARLPGSASRLVVDALEAFLEGLGVLQSPRLLAKAVAWTTFLWLWNSFGFWLAFQAFDIQEGFVAAVFVNSAVALFVAVPSAPGFFGTWHLAARVALADVYGVPVAQALSYAVGFHLAGFFPVTGLGLYYAWRLGLSLKDVGAAEVRVEEAVEAAHPEAVGLHGVGPEPQEGVAGTEGQDTP